jgi:hypothetical protein
LSRSGIKLDLTSAQLGDRIVNVRGVAALLDADLARIYGVETRVLNQAVKRNADRFPADFAFQLTLEEGKALRAARSQSVTLKTGQNLKYRPWAFTEHGAIMAATILNSPRAVEMSVFVVRAFVQLRELARGHSELAKQLAQLERRVTEHDEDLKNVIAAIRQLIEPPQKPRRPIGFAAKEPAR